MALLVPLFLVLLWTPVFAQTLTVPPGAWYHTHATNCRLVTTATQDQLCVENDGDVLRCFAPTGGASNTLCDEDNDWTIFAGSSTTNATQFHGRTVVSTAPTDGQIYKWVAANNQWELTADGGGGGSSTLQQAFDATSGNTINTATASRKLRIGSASTYKDIWANGTLWNEQVTPAQDLGTTLNTGFCHKWFKNDGTTLITSLCETGTFTTTSAGTVDSSAAASTKPCKSGTSAPGTCAVGECFADTDATAGATLLVCGPSANTWTAQGSGGGGGSFSGDVTGSFSLSGEISPATLSANQNDFAPTGLAGATVLRLSSDRVVALSGLTGGADGRILALTNVGAFPIHLLADSASSTAANRFAFDDLYLLPTDSMVLIYDSTSSRWRILSVAAVSRQFDPTSHYTMIDEFNGTNIASTLGWVSSLYGSVASVQNTGAGQDATGKAFGAFQGDTGSTATGGFTYLLGTSGTGHITATLGQAMFGWRVMVETLSTSSEEFVMRVGLHDAAGTTGTDATDGIYFEYDRATAGDFWRIVAAGGGTRTKTTSSQAVTTGYIWLLAITNPTWTSVSYFARPNGTTTWSLLGTIADGNIPTSTELMWPELKFDKTVGVTQRNVSWDTFFMHYNVKR